LRAALAEAQAGQVTPDATDDPTELSAWILADAGTVLRLMGASEIVIQNASLDDDLGGVATGEDDGEGPTPCCSITDPCCMCTYGGPDDGIGDDVKASTLSAPWDVSPRGLFDIATTTTLCCDCNDGGGWTPLCPGGCNDDNPCTIDFCNNGLCVHPPLQGPCCNDDAECEDGNDCTTDRCIDGDCWYGAANGFCDHDGNPCTRGFCDLGVCLNEGPVAAPCPYDDGNPCTNDICNEFATGCVHPPMPGTICEDDGNVCTNDVCDDAGTCTHPARPNGSNCPDDGNECKYDYCVNGTCMHPLFPDFTFCTDDGNECKQDYCLGGDCVHPSQPDGTVCDDDGDLCTQDSCFDGGCAHPPVDCDDGVFCNGVEQCLGNGPCETGTPPCPPELLCDEVHEACVECISGADCDDGDPCTADSCWGWDPPPGFGGVAKGKCVNEPLCPAGQTCCGGECCYPEDCCNDVCLSGSTASAAVTVHPKAVTFSGASLFVIARDDGSGDYGAPHWKDMSNPPDDDNADVGDHYIPVGYVRNSYMVLTAVFTVQPSDAFGAATSATVRGEATAGTAAFVFQGTATVSNGVITLPPTQADVALPNSVQYFNPLTVAWTITPTGGSAVSCNVPNTRHRVYVLLGAPNQASRYETLIHVGCTNAAGKSTENDVVAAIWNDFTNRNVRRKPADGFNNPDGRQLTYDANWACVNIDTAQLLATGDGQCGSWAKFFIDAMGGQGINHTNEYVLFYQSDGTGPQDPNYGFIVNNWSFASGAGRSGDANYPYLNVPASPFLSSNSYNWLFSEVMETPGVAGQGNANPASLFGNHQVVKLGTQYHDPSYGLQYSSFADIDTGAIAGYYKVTDLVLDETVLHVDLNNNGNQTDTAVNKLVVLFKKNPAGNQMVELLGEWPLP